MSVGLSAENVIFAYVFWGVIRLIQMLLVCLWEHVSFACVFRGLYVNWNAACVSVGEYNMCTCMCVLRMCGFVCVSCVCVGPTLALCCYWVLISSHSHRPPPWLLSSFSLAYLYIYIYRERERASNQMPCWINSFSCFIWHSYYIATQSCHLANK